jgi:hypothetical protein
MSTLSDKSETIYIGCQCHCPEHIVRVSYFDWQEKDEPELYLELQADNHLTFWNRLKVATKYVFGGANLSWHDVIPTHSDVIKLKTVVDNYVEDYKLYEKSQDGRD